MTKLNHGSEWSRWDLHVHTPLSIVNQYQGDQEQAWNDFIDKLKNLPKDIKSIAICDYLFIDGYERVMQHRDELTNLDLILPSIEFRLDTFAGTENNTKRHNYHVIFSNEVEPEIIKEQFLNGIQCGYMLSNKEEWKQNPTRRSLGDLGKMMKANAPQGNTIHRKSDLEAGFDNITYSRKELEKLLERDPFRNKHLTAIGYTEWSSGKWDQSAAEKRNLILSSAFCLTNNDNEDTIQTHIEDLLKNKLNHRVLHSSDAHTFERLDKTKLWIKADNTFNGLRVALKEYEDRIFIGETPPNLKQDSEVIKSVAIKNSNGWFEDDLKVELNPDMVSVIGGRGSGKTALVEMIAYAAGSFEETDDTFIHKAKKHRSQSINGTEIELEWRNGEVLKAVIGTPQPSSQVVQYMPQKYVEKIVDPQNPEELTEQIEKVVFDALSEASKQGSSSFTELQAQVVSPISSSKDFASTQLFEKNQSINSMRKDIASIPQKRSESKKLSESVEAMIKTLPKLSKEDEAVHKNLEKLEAEKFKIEKKIADFKNELTNVEKVDTQSTEYIEKLEKVSEWLNSSLEKLGVDETTRSALKIEFDDKLLQTTLTSLRTSIDTKIAKLKTGKKAEVAAIIDVKEEDLRHDNLNAYIKDIDEQQKKLKAHQTSRARYISIKERIQQQTRKKDALDKEIENLEKVTSPALAKALDERVNIFASYFSLVNKEKSITEELYEPLEESLASDDESSKSRLKFTAKIVYDIKAQLEAGLSILDRSKRGSFRNPQQLNEALADFYDEISEASLDSEAVKIAIQKLEDKFKVDEDGEAIGIKDQLRSSYDLGDFDNWLYNPDYYTISSSIQFDGIDINLLSPGQRGIVLLLLFLSIDSEDRRPLLIDQPEDNLDNLSVYTELIDSFRTKKKGRQIIIITHNPNLVVNTDSEQVVVAKFNGDERPLIKYKTGSLENKAELKIDDANDEVENGIIEEVCDILEGGGTALNLRQGKYHMSEIIKQASAN